MFQSVLSFNGGELSPYLAHRLDFEKHPTGAARVENFLPMPFGGMRKRPGTLFLAELPAAARLAPFIFDSSNRYLLAYSEDELNIYSPTGTLKDTVTADFSDPFGIQFARINDVTFIADPEHYPRRLSRVADTNWTIEDIPWDFAPLLDQNVDDNHTLTIAPSPTPAAWSASSVNYSDGTLVSRNGLYWECISTHTSAAATEPGVGASWPSRWKLHVFDVGDTITITSSQALFASTNVGGIWRFAWDRTTNFYEVDTELVISGWAAGTVYSPPIPILGRLQFLTTGTWTGKVTIEQSKDGETWTTLQSFEGNLDRNIDVELDFPSFRFARIRGDINAGVVGTPYPRAMLIPIDADINGTFEISAYTSATVVTATVKKSFPGGVSYKWNPAAYDPGQGYPATVAVHERRLIFAGTSAKPVSLWFSQTDDLLNFQTGTAATDGIFVTLATTSQDPIRWLASQRRLMIGTSTSEWICGSETNDSALSPENFNAREYTHYGSAALPAWRHNEGVFFIQRQARRFREIGYDITRETYDAADLTRLAEHITEGGITQIDFQTGREPYVWAVRADGTLLCFHYNRAERLAAWSRHTGADFAFRSIAVLDSPTEDDDIFAVIERSGTFYLVRFAPDAQAVQEAGDSAATIHLDLAVTGTTDVDGILSGLDHLEGETITFIADGIPGTATVTGGEIDTGRPSVTATAGLTFAATFETLPIDAAAQDGTTLGRRKRLNSIRANFYLTRGGTWTCNGDSWPISFDLTTDVPGEAPPLFTGWKDTSTPAGHIDDLVITFTHTDPWPCTIRALQIEWNPVE